MMLALFVFFGVVVYKTLANTPAFNLQLVSQTIVGEGRLPDSRYMYDLGQYEYQRGFAYLAETDTTPGRTSVTEEPASEGTLRYRAYEASDALEAAVRLDPGNARAWAALAWARARVDDYEGALEALRVSWEINPNNGTLANRRLTLFGFLVAPGPLQQDLNDADQGAAVRDAEVLRLFEPRDMQQLLLLHPHLSTMI